MAGDKGSHPAGEINFDVLSRRATDQEVTCSYYNISRPKLGCPEVGKHKQLEEDLEEDSYNVP